jgi:two-component system, OmpR family, KDP operon response regulator KdpE
MSQRPRILVCDHEPLSALALRRVLRDAGFDVDVTSSAADALDRAALRVPDAVIVELGLPDGDGADVCRRLREWSEMPLIVLSAVDAEDEKVRALDAGADHYVVKPFAPRELVARLSAVLRRAERHDTAPRFAVDGLQIDLAARVVRRENEEIHLTPIEFKLLRVLLRHRGRPLTHPVLLEQIWGPAYVEDRQTLRQHIANLRRKIELGGAPGVIRTEHGIGYRFADATPSRGRSAQPSRPDRLMGDGRRAA